MIFLKHGIPSTRATPPASRQACRQHGRVPWQVLVAMGLVTASFLLLVMRRWPGPASSDSPAHSGSQSSHGAFERLDAHQAAIQFRHVSGQSGQRYLPETMGGGVAVLDADGDGWLDIYVVQSGPTLPHGKLPPDILGAIGGGRRAAMLRNRGDGSFEDITDAAGLGFTGYGMGAVAGDVNGDGRTDIYVTAFGPNALYLNRGNGKFEDVSIESGTADPLWGTSAAMADVDLDGDLDLYVCNYLDLATDLSNHHVCVNGGHRSYCSPDDHAGAPDRLYINDGHGHFEERGAMAGVARNDGKGLGVVIVDLNGDRWPEIYVANDAVPNFLFVNHGDGSFDEQGVLSGSALSESGRPEAGMGVDVGDVDGDGDLDLVVTNFQEETNALYRRDGLLPRISPTDAALPAVPLYSETSFVSGMGEPSFHRLGFGCVFIDADTDGLLDLVVNNGHVFDNVQLYMETASHAQERQLFLGADSGKLRLAPASEAGDLASTPRVGRGLAVADLDRDGTPDLVVGNNDGPLEVLRGRSENARGRRVCVRLLATRSAPGGVGALVIARWLSPQTGQEQQRMDAILAGHSYLSSSPPEMHLAIGEAKAVDLEIHWPRTSGAPQQAHVELETQAVTVTVVEGGEARIDGVGPGPFAHPEEGK